MRRLRIQVQIRSLMAAVAVSALVITPFAWTSPGSRWPLLVAVLTVGSMLLVVASPFVLDWLGGDQRLRHRVSSRASAARRLSRAPVEPDPLEPQ
jgi:hypothetical protein